MPTPLWPVSPRLATSLILAAALIAPAAQAAEQRLREPELRAMVEAGALLCEAPRDGRCAAIVRWDASEGAPRETRLETMGGEPAVDMALQFTLRIEADQLCLTIRAEEIGYLFILGGSELTPAQAAPLRTPVARVWAQAEGRAWCTAYYRDTVTDALRAEVRIDGAPRLELDSVFQPIETSPLPPLRVVRQPWSAPVLRAARENAPIPTPLPVVAPTLGAPAPPPPVQAAAAPEPVTTTLCQGDPSRLQRLRRWLRLGSDPACAAGRQ